MLMYLLGGETLEDTPLQLLSGCHRRVESHLALLEQAADVLGNQAPGSDEALDALAKVQRYFATSGRIHTADEEESLFPRLRALGDAALDRIMSELEAQHRVADPLHAMLDHLCDRSRADREVSETDAVALQQVARGLRELYPGHIRREEEELFPRAGELLPPAEWDVVWAEMRRRRDETI